MTVKDGTTTDNVVGDAFYLNKGSKVDLGYLFSFGGNGKVKYASSDKSIVKVTNSSGKSYIKGVKTGEAVITATCGSEKKILKVNVIQSSNETTSMSVSSKFAEYSERMNDPTGRNDKDGTRAQIDRLLGNGEAKNCTMEIN
ncbi:MAG: Ig-like domain-containing protein [Eubacterium sp.]|nr:Ig-like domain-containing protein [Eubacterium sp.]MCM1439927.1 Ig-like domain-containing protein [Roseburia sp.]